MIEVTNPKSIYEVTVREFIEAIRQNGLPQAFGHLVEQDEHGTIFKACAIGQAGINMYNDAWKFTDYEAQDVIAMAIELNDDGFSLTGIADRLTERFTDELDTKLVPEPEPYDYAQY